MVDIFVQNFIQNRNLQNVEIIQRWIDKNDFSKGIVIGQNTACFVTRFQAIGEITNHNDLLKNLVTIESFNQFIDYSKICEVKSYGNLQILTSNLISTHTGNIVITLDSLNNIFANLVKCSIEYTLVRGTVKPIEIKQKVVEINIQEGKTNEQ